ncbi:MAG: nicotinate (nicotinamide) nucleotide adenylyltransferase [Desulfovibrio sp.]|nr:nicotinate (nicotinamide) nucleotide adenylyltransferase [Desulfovibrio sp.]
MDRFEAEAGKEKGVLIYGGSFNPPHIGHTRLAIEAREKLGHLLDEVVFMPVHTPPHKDPRGLLPFSFRARMIRESVARYSWMRCSELENERSGPSYTIDTLKLFRERNPNKRAYFLIGSHDFSLLPEWRDWRELFSLVSFAVAPRGNFSFEDLVRVARGMAPDIAVLRYDAPSPAGRAVIYFPAHFLDISSSLIREKWLRNENIDYLAPDPVADLLNQNKDFVKKYWRE